ncbi:MAG: helix-turn-helix domain-containing protein [Deltaproteobacteria bacterium]|nr:helix-turn-helix domain-containing protein [Deltaproteobacteria bacterium]
MAARERRGLSREAIVQQAHIPAHYLRMLEDNDYRLISDQLYLVPYLRKYASFLDIDPDETAMRLLHEIQRIDNSPSPHRLDAPLDDIRRYRRRNWNKPIMFGGLIAVIIGAYIVQSRHKDADIIPASTVQPSQAAAVSSPSSAPKEAPISFSAHQSTNAASVSEPHSSAPQQSISATAASMRRGTQTVRQAMIAPVMSPDRPSKLPRGSTPSARRVPSH